MNSPFFAFASRSLRVRFLATLLLGAALVTAVGSYATYHIAQSHIQNQLLERGRLLGSAINHAAMISSRRQDLQHVIDEVLNDNSDIRTIAIMLREARELIASASSENIEFSETSESHLWHDLVIATQSGHFGLHVEYNRDLVVTVPLWNTLVATDNRGQSNVHAHGGLQHQMEMPVSSPADHGSMVHSDGEVTEMVTGEDKTDPDHGHVTDGSNNNWNTRSLDSSEFRGAILLRVGRSGVLTAVNDILWGLMPISLVGVFAILALTYIILHYQVFSPIRDFRYVIKQQRSGNRQARAERQSTKEFDEVAIVFNEMIEVLAEREVVIEKLAMTDALTGLANRNQFNKSLQDSMKQAIDGKSRLALLFLDLDKFKNVNDTLGHMIGDLLLNEVAVRISDCTRDADVVARLGGDEFSIILRDSESVERVEEICKCITATISEPMQIEGVEVCIGVSIGISYFPEQAEDELTLIRNADLALYQVKDSARGSFQVYDKDIQAAAAEASTIEQDLRLAIARKEFFLQYQPQIDIHTKEMVGVEALIRWDHPERGVVQPNAFIPVAENTGLILAVGEWVLSEACAQAKAWQDAGLPPFVVAVNISSRQLMSPDFSALVEDVLDDSGLDPIWLELEVTESMMMGCVEEVSDILQTLSDLGISLAIDDFGTGHSSLSRLNNFPVDRIKIDRSFVRDVEPGSNDAAITTAIIQLARNLRLTVIAEGVETKEQLAYLREQKCDQAQGFLFAKPLSEDAFQEWYVNQHVPGFGVNSLRNIALEWQKGLAENEEDDQQVAQS